MDFIFEGAAEEAVDLIFPKSDRTKHLKNNLFTYLGRQDLQGEAEKLIEIDAVITKLWRAYTLIGTF